MHSQEEHLPKGNGMVVEVEGEMRVELVHLVQATLFSRPPLYSIHIFLKSN